MDREGARGRPQLQQLALDDEGRVGSHQEGAPATDSASASSAPLYHDEGPYRPPLLVDQSSSRGLLQPRGAACTPNPHQVLGEKLKETEFPPGGLLAHCRIRSAEVKGDCSVNNRKGRTFLIYEFEVKIK